MEETTNSDVPDPHLQPHNRSWLKTYIPLFLGESVSLLGSIIVQFAIVWWLTETTGSSTVLASGSIFIMLPGALLGPFLSTLVDRIDRRWVLVITDAIISLGTIFLVIMFYLDTIHLWHIFLVFGISSIFGNLQWAAVTAVTSTIVPEDQLQRVEGFTVTLQSLFNLAGPILGATLVTLLPVYGVLAIDAITALIAILLLLALRIPKVVTTPRHQALDPAGMWQDFKEGFRFLINYRGFMYLIVFFALTNFFLAPLFTFIPLLVTDYFGKGVLQLGLLNTFWGAGMALGGLVMTAWGGFKRKVKTIILGNVLFGIFVGIIAIAPVDQFWMALVGFALVATTMPMGNAPILALLQTKVPKEMQGRIFSLGQSLTSLATPIALAIAGPVAEKTGVHLWYWIGAIALLLLTSMFLLRPLYTLEDQEINGKGEFIVQPVVK